MAAKQTDFEKWKKDVPADVALVCCVFFDPRAIGFGLDSETSNLSCLAFIAP
jgi:hypothetical protein